MFNTTFIHFECAPPYEGRNACRVPAREADACEGNRPGERETHVRDACRVPAYEPLVEGSRDEERAVPGATAQVEIECKT